MNKSIVKQKLIKFPPMSPDSVISELNYFINEEGWTIKTSIPAHHGYSVVVFETTEEIEMNNPEVKE